MVEDYTNAFLVSFMCLLFMGLIAVWAIWGFLTALVVSYATDRAIVIEARRAHRD